MSLEPEECKGNNLVFANQMNPLKSFMTSRKSEFEASNFGMYLGGEDGIGQSQSASESHMLQVEGSEFPSPDENQIRRPQVNAQERLMNLTQCITGSKQLKRLSEPFEVGKGDQDSESYIIA